MRYVRVAALAIALAAVVVLPPTTEAVRHVPQSTISSGQIERIAGGTPVPMPATTGVGHWPPYIDRIKAEIDAYWRAQPFPSGYSYRSPTVEYTGYRPVNEIGCDGGMEPSFAFYCPANETIYWNVDLGSIGEAYGLDAVYATLAHEWTHHIQHILHEIPPGNALPDYMENQADCGAGSFLGSTGIFDRANWFVLAAPGGGSSPRGQALVRYFGALGDSVTTFGGTEFDRHGTRSERVRSFGIGMERGAVVGCGLPLDPAAA